MSAEAPEQVETADSVLPGMAQAADSFAGLRHATDDEKQTGTADGKRAASNNIEALFQYVPAAFTWAELAHGLAQSRNRRNPGRIHALHACLAAEPNRLQEERAVAGDEESIDAGAEAPASTSSRRQIRNFVARAMAPVVGNGEQDDGADEDENETSHGDRTSEHHVAAVRRSRAVADDAVAVLRRVTILSGLEPSDDDDDMQVLASIIATADAGQPWTTETAAVAARDLLKELRPPSAETETETETAAVYPKTQDWIVDGILNGYVRPLFARGPRRAGLTASGRKAQYGGGVSGSIASRSMDTETRAAKPWKYGDLRAVSVFAWALEESDYALVGRHWSLFTPVLLALIDDGDTDVRARGLVLLRAFVDKLPDRGRLLHNTGLDSVLADAVLPTLLMLPRLTPEEETLQLLDPAYAALLSIAATTTTTTRATTTSATTASASSLALLDRILREGVLAGYFHASEHVRVVEVLARQAGRVVEVMGIGAVRHLKDLVPMYAAILADPFAVRYTPVLEAAAEALQATMASCWPRLAGPPWQEEIARMLMLCWLNVLEDGEGGRGGDRGDDRDRDRARDRDRDRLQASLLHAADTLLAIMRAAGTDVEAAIRPLIAKEPRLGALFTIDQGRPEESEFK